jgi:TonB family protein
MKNIFLIILITFSSISFSQDKITGINDNEEAISVQATDVPPTSRDCLGENKKEKEDCFNDKVSNDLKNHFNYPPEALKKKLEGRVLVFFTIDVEGKVVNIQTKGGHIILQEEAKRIVSKMPKFEPAIKNGRPVSVKYSIPITFKLQD